MSITIAIANRGSATEKISDTSLTLTPSSNFTAGSYGILGVVSDNVGTVAGETATISVTDSVGNTWVKLREQTQTAGVALDGVTVALFLALISTLTTADTITMTWTANATAKGASVAQLDRAAGFEIVLSSGGANGTNAAAATTYSVALAGLTNVEGFYVGVTAAEGEAALDAITDAAYVAPAPGAGIFAANFGSGTGGIGPSNVIANAGTRAETSTGQTFDNTGMNSADRATIHVRLEESGFVPRNPAINHQNPAFL